MLSRTFFQLGSELLGLNIVNAVVDQSVTSVLPDKGPVMQTAFKHVMTSSWSYSYCAFWWSAWNGKSQMSYCGRMCREITQPLTCGDRINSVQDCQLHGCWCPGSLRRHDISTHDVDYVEQVSSYFTCGRVLITLLMSVQRNGVSYGKFSS